MNVYLQAFEQFLQQDDKNEEAIFVLFPAVRRAYDDHVPEKYSDEEFWRLYYNSMDAFMAHAR